MSPKHTGMCKRGCSEAARTGRAGWGSAPGGTQVPSRGPGPPGRQQPSRRLPRPSGKVRTPTSEAGESPNAAWWQLVRPGGGPDTGRVTEALKHSCRLPTPGAAGSAPDGACGTPPPDVARAGPASERRSEQVAPSPRRALIPTAPRQGDNPPGGDTRVNREISIRCLPLSGRHDLCGFVAAAQSHR